MFSRLDAWCSPQTLPFAFTVESDIRTELYCYRARYYHPDLQRFISEDPIEFAAGDTNLYAYARNNPLRFVDPLGLDVWCFFAGTVGSCSHVDNDTKNILRVIVIAGPFFQRAPQCGRLLCVFADDAFFDTLAYEGSPHLTFGPPYPQPRLITSANARHEVAVKALSRARAVSPVSDTPLPHPLSGRK